MPSLHFLQVQRRLVQRLRNTWLALAQLCWLLLTEIPVEISSSNIICQVCGAFTHLAWMLFWITSGAKNPWFKTTFALARCWGHLSHLCDEECGERVSSPPSHHHRSDDSPPGCLLCPWLLNHHQREHLHVYLWCRRKAFTTSLIFRRKHKHHLLDPARLHYQVSNFKKYQTQGSQDLGLRLNINGWCYH